MELSVYQFPGPLPLECLQAFALISMSVSKQGTPTICGCPPDFTLNQFEKGALEKTHTYVYMYTGSSGLGAVETGAFARCHQPKGLILVCPSLRVH